MSYDIIYNKQGIRLRRTGEVIMMLLAGSNNCYEIGVGRRNGRRTRDWSSDRYYNRKGKISEKPDVILQKLDAELRRVIRKDRSHEDPRPKPAHIRDHFGYYVAVVVGSGHCFDTSWNDYRGVYANGIKKALTIEELDALGVNPYFDAFTWRVREDEPEIPPKPPPVNIKTEQEYFAELNKWREWQKLAGKQFYLSFSPSDTDLVLKRLKGNNHRQPKEHTRVEQDFYYALVNNNGTLVKYTSRGYRYSLFGSSGKKFRTEKEAENYRQKLVTRGRHQADTWKVKMVESKATFYV